MELVQLYTEGSEFLINTEIRADVFVCCSINL